MDNKLTKIQAATLTSNLVDTTNYALPIGAFTVLMFAILKRYFPDMGDELHAAVVGFSAIVFNYLLVAFKFIWEKVTKKYVIDD